MAKLAKNDGADATSHSKSGITSGVTPSVATPSGATGGLSARALVSIDSASMPISRHELIAIILVTLVGIGLRVAFPSRMAVEHFDEGVYASNIFFDAEQGYRFPNQHLYSPPLLPWLIEMVFILFGPSNVGAMVPSLVAGCLTVPLLWWVGRRWFGPTAGLAASILCATNDIHILFSRSALTDVLLCFWLLLAVYLFWEAITRDHLGLAIAAGMATSLAWWTKYTGWLPLAITSAGLALSWLLDRRTRAGWKRHATCWLITAGVAALLWSPWLWSLQPHGGYSAVAANHRGYVVGFRGWMDSLRVHYYNQSELDEILTWLGFVCSFSLPLVCGMKERGWGFTWNVRHELGRGLTFLGLVLFVLLGWTQKNGRDLFLVSMFPAMSFIGSRQVRMLVLGDSAGREIGTCLLAVAFTGLLLTSPFYTPFPRLAIPLLSTIWLGCGVIASVQPSIVLNSNPERVRVIRLRVWFLLVFMVVCLSLFRFDRALAAKIATSQVPGWQSRINILQNAEQAIADGRSAGALVDDAVKTQSAFYVYGEPALYFQLRRAGVELVRPVEHLAFARAGKPVPPVPVFLVTGPHAERNPNFARQFDEVKDRLKLVKEYEYQPSDLVWRDQRREFDAPPKFHVKLYRVE